MIKITQISFKMLISKEGARLLQLRAFKES